MVATKVVGGRWENMARNRDFCNLIDSSQCGFTTMNIPVHCRPAAFQLFAEQIPVLDTTVGLLHAAIAISMHGLDDVDPAGIEDQLQEMADHISSQVNGVQPQALLAHLHHFLFDEEGFRGNAEDYYCSDNNYLSRVLASRNGIPITLCLIYKIVAEQIGLRVEGVNAPGHFLVRVFSGRDTLIVDPFFLGSVLTESESFDRVEEVTGRTVPRSDQYLAAATHSQWLSRMLVNLQHIFATQ
ncbi:MAG: transglutaminase-like domain-containing protein, partial [Pirellulaceae bacterium]|nr:transglutaminase-like domain-containing protein [Pirellulaceae bacterium]